ncbi:MAG: CaiB/BaiF CoA transferase family protein [Hyphomicrobiales bacterium]
MTDQPFAGITVIELGQFVAVPYCAQLMSEGGARVIKVEPHEGDPSRHLGQLAPYETRYFVARNRGKRSLPLDLRHPRAARVLDALFQEADVALMNLRPGLAPELGLDFATLSARYPRLVVGNVTAFGKQGPDAGLAGMDLVVQARSGLMAAMGKMNGGLPAIGESPIVDYMAAVLLAFGVSSALLRRERTGRGGEVDVSLLASAMALQNNLFARVEITDGSLHAELRTWLTEARASGVPFAEQAARSPSPRTSAMTSVYYRTYATKDSAIAVACVSSGLQRRFLGATGLEDGAREGGISDRAELAKHYAELQRAAEARMAEKTTAEWKTVFDAAGVPASQVYLPFELLDDPQVLANDMVADVQHPALGPVRVLSPPLAIDGDGFRIAQPTPPFGSQAREVLAEFGLSSEEIEACLREGAVRADG